MANLNYRDIPLLRGAGFEVGPLAVSWFGRDKYGQQWQVWEEEDTGMLMFDQMGTRLMSHEEFVDLFKSTETI